MLRLSLEHLRPGLVTARNIYNANGSLLLGRDILLDERLIARLANMDIDSVYVKNPYLSHEAQEILHEKTRVETVKITHNTFQTFRKNGAINVAGLRNAIKMIIEDVVDNKQVLIHLTDIRTHDDYTFSHSINTCLIAAVIGLKMRLTELQLQELALGVILHDIGKMLIAPEVLNKKEPLAADEWQIIKGHSQAGFDVLRQQSAIPLLAAHIAYQHHENFDGSGYPRGLAGEEIHRYARIAAIADLYDAITSDRPYRPALLPHEAYEVVLASRGTKLDPAITDIFLENVALFPVGTVVLLDTGETGVVAQVLPRLQARPLVKLILDKAGKAITEQTRMIDLTQELTRFIVKVFKPEEVAAFGEK
ncbi:MAG: HD-GYP domain-containing protein [Negativicutes bacterium]|nr:HD-GYP domain-containing protein [Negativicutes bacterium]